MSAFPTGWIAKVNTAQTYLQLIGLFVYVEYCAVVRDVAPVLIDSTSVIV